MKKLVTSTLFLLAFSAVAVVAQPRQAPKAETTTVKPANAPNSFAVEYHGGVFGFSKEIDGTLNFDDDGERFVFRNKENKEVFAFPYKSLIVVQPSSRSEQSTAGTVTQNIPLPGAGILGGFIKTKKRFLVVQFNDTDSEVSGVVNFKVPNKELLESVIYALGTKAKLKQRGDAFYRPRPEPQKPII